MMDFEFEKDVKKTSDGCWIWLSKFYRNTPVLNKRKYGTSSAKRFIYNKYIGFIADEDIHVINTCNNLNCVNPPVARAVKRFDARPCCMLAHNDNS